MSVIGPNKDLDVFPGPNKDKPVTLRECREELRWMSGSNDFSSGGFARIGWDKGPGPLLARLTDDALERDEKRRALLEELNDSAKKIPAIMLQALKISRKQRGDDSVPLEREVNDWVKNWDQFAAVIDKLRTIPK